MILNFNLDADVAQRVGLVNESGMRELANDLHMCRTAVVDNVAHFIVFEMDDKYFKLTDIDLPDWGLDDRNVLQVRAMLKESYIEFLAECLTEVPISALANLVNHPNDVDLETMRNLGYLSLVPSEQLPEELLGLTIRRRAMLRKELKEYIQTNHLVD